MSEIVDDWLMGKIKHYGNFTLIALGTVLILPVLFFQGFLGLFLAAMGLGGSPTVGIVLYLLAFLAALVGTVGLLGYSFHKKSFWYLLPAPYLVPIVHFVGTSQRLPSLIDLQEIVYQPVQHFLRAYEVIAN